MSSFSLMPYQPSSETIWNETVRRSKNGNFLHLRDYMGYHSHRYNEQSILVLCKGKPVAAFPCNLHDDTIISHAGLTYGGLIYGTDLHVVDVLEIFTLLAAHYQGLGAKRLRYKAIPHIFHRYPAEEDLYALFRLNARLVRRDISSVIDLTGRLKLSDSRRNTIRKAEKNNAQFVEQKSLGEFHELLGKALDKFGAKPVHALDELELLQSRFPEGIRLFGAIRDGQLLAGALIYDFGMVAHTQYLASSDEGREMGALDFVLANLLDDVFSNHRYFSFGISTEQEGRYLNEGLVFQKEGFGGRGVAHDFYEVEL